MFERDLSASLRSVARHYPVVTLTGPRQSGKTTLCRAVFADMAYVNLEPMDQRDFARSDPREFLLRYADGAIIDEIQRAPELVSYLQEAVDENPAPGRFVLTGSQNLAVSSAITQSLAGRTAVLHLLPMSASEMMGANCLADDRWQALLTGGFPRIHDRQLDASRWLRDYLTTYVERDVREVRNVGDLEAFRQFLGLAAGRTAQEINLSSLGGDAGVSHNTARSWLSVLQAGFVTFPVPAWHRNLRKQLVKAAKLHFIDTGLVCALLGIETAQQLRTHPLRGAIFETWVAGEILKQRYHQGLAAGLRHYRQARGTEIDLLVEGGQGLNAVECKSGQTLDASFFKNLHQFTTLLSKHQPQVSVSRFLVYGGTDKVERRNSHVLGWNQIAEAALL